MEFARARNIRPWPAAIVPESDPSLVIRVPKGGDSELLFHEEFVRLFDAKTCAVAAPITLDAYLALPHPVMSRAGEVSGPLDGLLHPDGAERFVFLATPHLPRIPFLLYRQRVPASVPRCMAENCAGATGPTVSPLPFAAPGLDVSVLWHARSGGDPALAWSRGIICAPRSKGGLR